MLFRLLNEILRNLTPQSQSKHAQYEGSSHSATLNRDLLPIYVTQIVQYYFCWGFYVSDSIQL